jgi:hypothetical protein
MSAVLAQPEIAPRRPDWVAGHVGFEPATVICKYPLWVVGWISADSGTFEDQRLYGRELLGSSRLELRGLELTAMPLMIPPLWFWGMAGCVEFTSELSIRPLPEKASDDSNLGRNKIRCVEQKGLDFLCGRSVTVAARRAP